MRMAGEQDLAHSDTEAAESQKLQTLPTADTSFNPGGLKDIWDNIFTFSPRIARCQLSRLEYTLQFSTYRV